jgi:hypothetical protein
VTPPRAALLAIIATCAVMAVMSAADLRLVTTVHGDPLPWNVVFWATTPRWILFAIALPLVLRVTMRHPPWPLARRTLLIQVGLFLALTLAHALVHGASIGASVPLSGGYGLELRVVRVYIGSAPVLIPLYAGTLLRARALRASQLEAQLQTARLAALRAQLSPHFLYNTLNGIATLVADAQNGRAGSALEELAELLHAAYRDDGRELIPLGEEVALASRYLELQQLRFGDRLQHTVQLDARAAGVVVPPLILQPLVENAVLHGLAGRQGVMRLTLEVRATATAVSVVIAHDGPVLPAHWAAVSAAGVGLANTRARLETAFDARATLHVERRAEGGVESRLVIAEAL